MKSTFSRLALALVLYSSVAYSLRAAAPQAQDDFFQRVSSGNVSQLLSVMHPELRLEIDSPVLDAWIQAFNERLGNVTEITLVAWTQQLRTDGKLVTTTCELHCEKGQAKSELSVLNGQIVAFDVSSDLLTKFFTGPTSTEIYEEQGMAFIRTFLAGDAAATHELCHEALQKAITLDELAEMIQLITARVGTLENTTLTQVRMEIDDEGEKMRLDFDLGGTEGSITCEIKFEFVGLKGHILGFNFR